MRRICLILSLILCILLLSTSVYAMNKRIEKSNEQDTNTVTTITENGKEEDSIETDEILVIILFIIIFLSFIVSYIIGTILQFKFKFKNVFK